VFLSAPAYAGALQGDWTSAGGKAAPLPPYNPSYDYDYLCQAELSDNIERPGNGKIVPKEDSYKIVAVADLHWNKDHPNLDFNSAKWTWLALKIDGSENAQEILLGPDFDKPFRAEGVDSNARLQRSNTPDSDRMTLNATLNLNLGKYTFSQSKLAFGNRADSEIDLKVTISVQDNSSEGTTVDRVLYLECRREK
jgi:hypothetical protein